MIERMQGPAGKITHLLVLACGGLLSVIGCGGRLCSAAYFFCDTAIQMQPVPALGSGTYAIHVQSGVKAFDITCSSLNTGQRFECASSDPSTFVDQSSPDAWSLHLPTESSSMRLVVQRNGTGILDQPVALTYQTSEPNGPGCGTCRRAQGTVNLE